MKKYELLADRFDHKRGTVVYETRAHDYGLARDDTNMTGIQHVSVTINEDGDYPFFTVPEHQLKRME